MAVATVAGRERRNAGEEGAEGGGVESVRVRGGDAGGAEAGSTSRAGDARLKSGAAAARRADGSGNAQTGSSMQGSS